MKSFTTIAAISAIASTVSAQTTLTGFGIGPVSGNTEFQNQTLFQTANAKPNFTESIPITAGTTPSEKWSWQINVTDIAASPDQVVNTVISLTWPEETTANSVCAIAINGAPITYKTNPGSDGSCSTVLSGCIGDLTTSVGKGLIASDGTVECGTDVTNITVPSSCSSFISGANVNVSASPMGNLQSGAAWIYSANIGASPSLDDSATRVWPIFLMHTAGKNVTSFADPVCLQAEASKATATSSSSASGTSATAAASTTAKKGAAMAMNANSGFVFVTLALTVLAMMI